MHCALLVDGEPSFKDLDVMLRAGTHKLVKTMRLMPVAALRHVASCVMHADG
jgi:hypothetical protein